MINSKKRKIVHIHEIILPIPKEKLNENLINDIIIFGEGILQVIDIDDYYEENNNESSSIIRLMIDEEYNNLFEENAPSFFLKIFGHNYGQLEPIK